MSSEVEDSQIIQPELLNKKLDPSTDLILIRTGYEKFRGTNRYTLTPPGLSSKTAEFLRTHYPKLRCIGMDLISISSYSDREEGRKAHHAYLNPDTGNPVLIIEDMKLSSINYLKKVIVAPLLVDEADGAPCTVFGYI